MSLISVIWPMISTVCLTLAIIQLIAWLKQRELRANLLFSILAMSTAVYAVFELLMMRAETPERLVVLYRWFQIPAWFVVLSVVAFVPVYLRVGGPWLAWTIAALRTLVLVLNFAARTNFNFREITAVRHIQMLAESVSVAVGVPNPWIVLGHISLLLLLAFVMDATITTWRRGDHQRALIVGGSIVFFVTATVVQAILLVLRGFIVTPITGSAFLLGVVIALSREMAQDVLHATRQARDLLAQKTDLRENEDCLSLAAEAANASLWSLDANMGRFWATSRMLEMFDLAPGFESGIHSVLDVAGPHDSPTGARNPHAPRANVMPWRGHWTWMPRLDTLRRFCKDDPVIVASGAP